MHLRHRVVPAVVLFLCVTAFVPARADSPVVHVSDVEGLYRVANDPAYGGAGIVLAAGDYALTPLDPYGQPRPNGGELFLQHDMSLSGSPGHPGAVVIDGAALTAAGGVIRTGNGNSAIEWLTVDHTALANAAIDTSQGTGAPVHIRLAHLVIQHAQRGIDIRNPGTAMHRVLEADIDHNEFRDNATGFGQGMRIVNMSNGSAIHASLHGNDVQGNITGLTVANLNCAGSTITIDSQGDAFDGNGVGVLLLGGNTNTSGSQSNGNLVTFDAHASSIRDNTGASAGGFIGGLVAVGGERNMPGLASSNTVLVGLWGTKLSGNRGYDIFGYGAVPDAPVPAGTDNAVTIELNGVSKKATVQPPVAEPGGNTVTIVR